MERKISKSNSHYKDIIKNKIETLYILNNEQTMIINVSKAKKWLGF